MSEVDDADQPAPDAYEASEITEAELPAPAAAVADQPDTDEPAPVAHEASEISYAEQFYPARPARLRPQRRLRDLFKLRPKVDRTGKPSGDNHAYVDWLINESMLEDAKAFATQFSGQRSMWQNSSAKCTRLILSSTVYEDAMAGTAFQAAFIPTHSCLANL